MLLCTMNSVLYNEFQGLNHKNCIVLPECAYINSIKWKQNYGWISGSRVTDLRTNGLTVAWGLWSGAFESIYFHINCIVVIQSFLSTALNCIVMLHHMYIKSFFFSLRNPSLILHNSINVGPVSSCLQPCGKSSAASLWTLEVSLKMVMTTLWI